MLIKNQKKKISMLYARPKVNVISESFPHQKPLEISKNIIVDTTKSSQTKQTSDVPYKKICIVKFQASPQASVSLMKKILWKSNLTKLSTSATKSSKESK